ncbi:MAG: aconitate hydratase AcnA [Elusimicrobia bacterium]|nr:aconitate hydratase AcnA [Elusimicrobiota bacterium]
MNAKRLDSFRSRKTLRVGDKPFTMFGLEALQTAGFNIVRLPYSLKIFLENLLRNEDGRFVTADDIRAVARWSPSQPPEREVMFMPARVLMQDFTGVPAVVDLAAMRQAIQQLGGDPAKINPLLPVDLVIDHSVQVDQFGTLDAFQFNTDREFQRNQERYAFLRWAQRAFRNYRVVPPGTGIVHQVNLEYLAPVVCTIAANGETMAFPDTLVGTDSHTTMINGLGVLGWGVGGIEAEAAMLGQPLSMVIPKVVGVKLTGRLAEGATAADVVLTVTELLRRHNVVGKFVEFYGPGLSALSLPDRATVANMAPEYGATVGFFPVDDHTLSYLEMTGRPQQLIDLVETYTKAQGLFRTETTPDPRYSEAAELDLGAVQPCLAGPTRPQDRVLLKDSQRTWRQALVKALEKQTEALDLERLRDWANEGGPNAHATQVAVQTPSLQAISATVPVEWQGRRFDLSHGSVVIAAITSCTNTSNPSAMIGAGLLAKKAVKRGLSVNPWVKTSLAPGSKVVMDYLKGADLLPYLEQLGFYLVGFGCTTCIGNSGPLPPPISNAIFQKNLVVAAVLSGNRNFEGRINPFVKASYLASPPLVVAYALAGHMDVNLTRDPLGHDEKGHPVFLRDIWPSPQEIQETIRRHVTQEMFTAQYQNVFQGDERWQRLAVPEGELFAWDDRSTYIKHPPYFEPMTRNAPALEDIHGARMLIVVGDSVTTDHISPAGGIPQTLPAGQYLIEHHVSPHEFNSYGARRGNHEVMMRGTFANIRIRNLMVPGTEGGVTVHLPDKKSLSVYEAAMLYQKERIPLIVLAGKEYGAGSSRDWAAKGPALLGVKAVIAETYERIHRSNLVGMGVLPLQFRPGETRETLGLTGFEIYDIAGIADNLHPGKELTVQARREDGTTKTFQVIARLDTAVEVEYYHHGGILPYVLRQILKDASA